MGRTPLDNKQKQKCDQKKGLWSPDEDEMLRNYILNHGHGCWSSLPTNAGLQRNGKSCRLRWINYLRPGLKRGVFSFEEEEIVLNLHRMFGNKWSQIAHHLPGRTDNEIKNYWHSHLKKRAPKTVETKAHSKDECSISGKMQELKPSSPFENTKVSLMGSGQSMQELKPSPFGPIYSDQSSMQEMENSKGGRKCNLPKLLFSEWMYLDQFNGHDLVSSGSVAADSKYSLDNTNNAISSEGSSSHGPLLDEEAAFESATHPERNSITNPVDDDDILQSSPFIFEDHITECGLLDYFQGEFNVFGDDMYMKDVDQENLWEDLF